MNMKKKTSFIFLLLTSVLQYTKSSQIRRRRSLSLDNSLSDDGTKLAWLLSFPGSGAEFIINFIHSYTNTTTATNYGDANIVIPVYTDRPNGPFRIHETNPLPAKYTLSLTYCGGRCYRCAPNQYIYRRDAFLMQCSYGLKGASQERVQYDSKLVHKAVVFIRHPYYVIMDRFEYYKFVVNPDVYRRNREGFLKYCADEYTQFSRHEEAYYDPDIYALAKDIPCHAELYRYVQWYNLVFEVLEFEDILYTVEYYEDFDQKRLLKFLEYDDIDLTNARTMNRTEVDYGYFSEEEKYQLGLLFKALVSNYTNTYFQRFEL